ncbi:hypothetical protein I3843_09G072100 [Carya illinoinensis]|uniref:Plant bHLH transcription factor ACT-like domain-containing protein n=1 Tax=Carya illinoinensis TaxID=32201 RepID=A0A8T1PBG5_CARIL|nr:uncharacterized protein LOC122277336 [Carya illinoinensis]KAG2687921.1 hypothetical protein I3760_09G071700 [Carya illinoinensis]KAG6641429.1 hypothetical protein CIPAW_09G072500 [Carya illinoinensis]KAG6694932.1 hypothetical protein I3842_09G072000 [Carya illinoinensis]KAG7962561.1 hypothetical protein I3843_09G072100 [Carya illinoinensis]
MASMLQKRMTLRRKIHILRAHSSSKSLKLKLEAIKREYSRLMAIKRQYLKLMKRMQVPNKDVEVHKVGQGFLVRVNCEKGTDRLVTILEAFDEMGLNVQQAKVSCSNCFAMEAIAVAEDQALDVKEVIKALLRTTEKKGGEPTHD